MTQTLDARGRTKHALLRRAAEAGCRPFVLQELDRTVDFVDQECEPRAAEMERSNAFPPELKARMQAMGHFGFTMPKEYGGMGMTTTEYMFICMAYGRSAVAFHLMVALNNGLGTRGILYNGSPAQKQRYLGGLTRGDLLAAFCLTEPGAGSDAGGIQTRAQLKDGRWVINGKKHFISNFNCADFYFVFAVTDPDKGAHGGITAFIVDKGTPGLKPGEEQFFMGAIGNPNGEVLFEDCAVDPSMVCGEVGYGLSIALQSIDHSRLTIGARHTQSAELLMEMSVDWAGQRRTFGKHLGEHQAIQFMIADMATEVHLANLLVIDAAQRYDRGENVNMECAMVKLYCIEMANRTADATLQIHGGYGYSKSMPIERFYRDLRGPRLWDGSMEMQRHVIAKRKLRGYAGSKAAAVSKDVLAQLSR